MALAKDYSSIALRDRLGATKLNSSKITHKLILHSRIGFIYNRSWIGVITGIGNGF